MNFSGFFGIIGLYGLVYGITTYLFGNEPIEPITLIVMGFINLLLSVFFFLADYYFKGKQSEVRE